MLRNEALPARNPAGRLFVSAGFFSQVRRRHPPDRIDDREIRSVSPMKLSIIIPVLNEREELPCTHKLLTAMLEAPEIIAVDGGSTDGTLEWLRGQNSIKTIEAQRGRGGQLNAGAAASCGDVLLFLHADCVLPSGALSGISDALEDSRVAGGCFLVRFGGPRLASLRLVQGGINLRTQALWAFRCFASQSNHFAAPLAREGCLAHHLFNVHPPAWLSCGDSACHAEPLVWRCAATSVDTEGSRRQRE